MHNLFEQTFSLLIIDLWIGQSDQVGNNRPRPKTWLQVNYEVYVNLPLVQMRLKLNKKDL